MEKGKPNEENEIVKALEDIHFGKLFLIFLLSML